MNDPSAAAPVIAAHGAAQLPAVMLVGDEPGTDVAKKKIDKALAGDDLDTAGIVLGTIEDFSQALAQVIRRFLKLKDWKDTERIVRGGGLRDSRVGAGQIPSAGIAARSNPGNRRPRHRHRYAQ